MSKNTIQEFAQNKSKLLNRSIFFIFWALGTSLLIYVSQNRLIARDEGYYLYAAELVSQGLRPYLDFFYPQMPLLPYFYALPLELLGWGWEQARLVSALITSLLLLVLMFSVKERSPLLPALVALLFCGSNFILPWYTTVQTYSLSALLAFSGFLLINSLKAHSELEPSEKRTIHWKLLLAGFLLGSAVSVRLTMGVLFPAVLLHWLFSARPQFLKYSFWLLLGGLLAATPVIALLFLNPDSFFYNNLGYHLTRSLHSTQEDLEQAGKVLAVILGFRVTEKFSAFQLPLLLWVFLLQSAYLLVRRRSSLCHLCLIALLLAHALPKPTYVHYFAILLPWLIYMLVEFFAQLLSYQRRLALILMLIFAASYLYQINLDLKAYTRTGRGVIGIITQENAEKWNLKQLKAIQAFLINSKQEVAFSIWPGFLVGTGVTALAGSENHFALAAANKLTSEQAAQYHTLRFQDLNDLIKQRQIPLVLMLNTKRPSPSIKRLDQAGYRKIQSLGPTVVYAR